MTREWTDWRDNKRLFGYIQIFSISIQAHSESYKIIQSHSNWFHYGYFIPIKGNILKVSHFLLSFPKYRSYSLIIKGDNFVIRGVSNFSTKTLRRRNSSKEICHMMAYAKDSNFSAFSIKSKLTCYALKFRFFCTNWCSSNALKFEFLAYASTWQISFEDFLH